MISPANAEDHLIERMRGFQHDPHGWVRYSFPWGEQGGPLADKKGPRPWQIELLESIGEKLRDGSKTVHEVIQEAIASGHGIGKSTVVSWIVLWALSTMADTKGVVTANTDTQLRTKTWAEIAKWYNLMICKHWFQFNARSIHSKAKGHHDTWRIDAIPWSDKNPEAFAGLHNEGKRIIVVFDEASAISDKIWEVTEGALTDANTEIIWCAFGNPTRNTGRFRECFRRYRHRWNHKQIDSRTVDGTNKVQLQKWVDDWGEDSDFVRIRVRGTFPKSSSMQFFNSELVHQAMHCEARCNLGDPLIMSLDIARGGDDNCVIAFRRGLDASSKKMRITPGSEAKDSMQYAAVVVDCLTKEKPDAFFFDGVGVGGPVGDRVRQLGFKPIEVKGSEASPDPAYGNMRTYMYAKLRDWLEAGGALPDDPELEMELTAIEFTHNKSDKLVLIPKDVMKADLGFSPDRADSQAMLHAYPVAPVRGIGAAGNEQSSYNYEPTLG